MFDIYIESGELSHQNQWSIPLLVRSLSHFGDANDNPVFTQMRNHTHGYQAGQFAH